MSLLDAAGVVTGDIWCTGAFSFESPLKDLLDSGEYTIEQLLAEDELLQELRGVHPQLIEFFSTEEAVSRLIQYVILPYGAPPPNPDLLKPVEPTNAEDGADVTDGAAEDENNEGSEDPAVGTERPSHQDQIDMVYVRFPYMACEVICCEIDGIVDTIVDGFVPTTEEPVKSVVAPETGGEAEVTLTDPRPQTILDLLFSMLYNSKRGEIDDYRAGYFDKLLSVLFRKRPQAMSQYVNEGGGRGGITLMKVMCKHLYSHSIMQIVQRLLLPQIPMAPPVEDDPDNPGDDPYGDGLDGADLNGMGGFRCSWSDSLESLDLLLDCLIGKDSSQPQIEEGKLSEEEFELEHERTLSLCQNASEVLITIIQNSPLTSPTLNALTTDPIMQKLIIAASSHDDGEDFSPHDSKLTCTMNVLESLILQLGGYGSVGTVVMPEDEEDNEDQDEGVEVQDGGVPQQDRKQELATSETLISHLPMMLSSLCKLLLHPSAEKWVSPMQFSKTEPQKLLGSSRLRIVRLLESLVLLGDPSVDALLCESNCLEICLDLFWKFQWCSMLHQSVANLLVHVFEGANARSELQSYFMVKCNLLGRLMDSFFEANEEAVMNVKNTDLPTSSGDSERENTDGAAVGEGDKADAIPVSDDDVDAALEQQESESPTDGKQGSEEKTEQDGDLPVKDTEPEQANVSESLNSSMRAMPAQSFRLGYMGHVIIICQALVHACTNDGAKSEAPSMAEGGSVSLAGMSTGELRSNQEPNGELGRYVSSHNSDDPDSQPQEGVALHDGLERGRAVDSVVTDETPQNPLILAQLVDTHPLRSRWQDFVTTTLASETAIQSTPLGGYNVPPGGMDPLHAHRPGLADEGEYVDDDGAAPPLPPRGLLVGGDVIDMDDNDLDIAASMMAGLTLGRSSGNASEKRADGSRDMSGDPSQDASPAGNYMFDDPLGKGGFGKFDQDDDDNSSSDEESGTTSHSGDSGNVVVEGVSYSNSAGGDGSPGDQEDVPVMDLFAGNFESFGSDNKEGASSNSGGANQGTWSNFANFDDAFAGGVAPPAEEPEIAEATEVATTTPNGDVDEIFAQPKEHAIVLDESEEKPVEEPKSQDSAGDTDADRKEVDGEEPVAEEVNQETTEEVAAAD